MWMMMSLRCAPLMLLGSHASTDDLTTTIPQHTTTHGHAKNGNNFCLVCMSSGKP